MAGQALLRRKFGVGAAYTAPTFVGQFTNTVPAMHHDSTALVALRKSRRALNIFCYTSVLSSRNRHTVRLIIPADSFFLRF